MKKITLLFTFLISTFAFSQVGVSENFDGGTPAGWTDSYANTATAACAGNSERDNLYNFSTSGNITSPNQVGASNGTDLTISFDYKIVEYNFSNPTVPQGTGWGTAELQYSTDDGANWTTVLTIDDSNHVTSASCATMMATIPAASLPNGSDVKLQIANTWAAGDYYFYVDNFNATQVTASPPNCTALTTPTNGATDVNEDTDLVWAAATGVATGYKLTVGTTSGGTDIVNNVDVGLVTTYALSTLTYGATYYVTIVPYNANGDAVGCTEESFTVRATPPAGQVCANPIVVNTLPYNTSDDTATYLDDYSGSAGTSCGSTSNYLNGDDVVYSYTPAADASIDINVTALGDTYAGVFVYTDCADIGTACQAGDVNGNSSDDLGVEDFAVTGGTTYYIVISTWANPQSTTYTLDITENSCINPVATYTAVPDCGNNQFTVNVDVTDLGTATSLTITDDQGSASQQVTMLGIASFGPYASGTAVNFTVTNDQDGTCLIMGSSQYFCPPANDECAAAEALTVNADLNCGTVTSGTIGGATASAQTDDVTGTPNTDVWYSFVATADRHEIKLLNVANQGGGTSTSTDMGMGLYDGTGGCMGLTLVTDSDPNTMDATGLTAGTTYLVRVYGWGNNIAINNFDICVGTFPPPPANDLCANAIALTPGGVFGTNPVVATNASATDSGETPAPGCASYSGGDLWFSVVVPADGILTLETNSFTGSSVTDMGAAVYSGTCGSLTLVECDDDDSDDGNHSKVDINDPALANQTVYFRVWEYGNNVFGQFQVSAYAASLSVESAEVRGFTHYVDNVNNAFVINAQNTVERVALYNLAGQVISTSEPGEASTSIGLGAIKTGVYFARVTLQNGKTSVVKFFVN